MPRNESFHPVRVYAMTIDPVHVGTGASRLGSVDNTIVRDPVTRVPKIPGSSLAGVYRAYVAMQEGPERYRSCAGQGGSGGEQGHCGKIGKCRVCTMFGHATTRAGGFAGLAGFSDAHLVLFPVATRLGPRWIGSPSSLREMRHLPSDNIAYTLGGIRSEGGKGAKEIEDESGRSLNFGWLQLEVDTLEAEMADVFREALEIEGLPEVVEDKVLLVSDKLFAYIVNSNLEVRTSVAIDPATGAAESGALFTYEAIPRSTILSWELTFRNPAHFLTGESVPTLDEAVGWVRNGEALLAHLGIGGMGTRGLGRVQVLDSKDEGTSSRGEL